MPNTNRWTVFAVIALLAFGVRLPRLGERPMHTDEAVNAYIVGNLLAGESFRYDPQDRHGPTLYLLAKPVVRLCGAKTFSDLTETQVRLTPVIVSSIMVLLFGAGVEMFGFGVCLVAALLFALAPLPVYYGRYFIHESFFVAAMLGLILAGGRAVKTRSLLAAALAGFCAGLMLATKETAVIHFFALAVAGVCGWVWNARLSGMQPHEKKNWLCCVMALGAFVITTVLLFTWFGRNWAALGDLVRAMPHFAKRAAGAGHEKPFWYYIVLLAGGWSGAVLLTLAIAGLIIGILDFAKQQAFTPLLFICLYGVIVAAIYSIIPYKTPWLALNFWLPMSLLIGLAVTRIWKMLEPSPARWWLLVPAALVIGAMARDVQNRVFRFAADENNPYAYAHTVEDLLRLPTRLEELAKEEHLTSPRIAVVAADAWPLPWYLRKFSQVGFWQPGQNTGPADFFITSPEAAEKLADKLHNCRPEFFGVRPEAVIILWKPDSPATNAPPSRP